MKSLTVIFPVRLASSVLASSRNNGSVISLFALANFLFKQKKKDRFFKVYVQNDRLKETYGAWIRRERSNCSAAAFRA